MAEDDIKPRVVAIAQARMTSTRLPGKVMMEVLGRPLLDYHMSRLSQAKLIDRAVLATSIEESDDCIATYCRKAGFACFRGSRDDVLERFVACAREHDADIVVRTTCDCPLIDPELVDRALAAFFDQRGEADYLAPAAGAFPRGFDLEVVPRPHLETAHEETSDPYDREHVTPFSHRRPKRSRPCLDPA